MTTGKALNEKLRAGNPHVRFDGGEVASVATPRRGSLLCNISMKKAVAMAAALVSLASSAATYYVKKTGSDATGDGSEGNPYLTIQKAVDSLTSDGETIIVGPGEYGESEGTRVGNGDDKCLTRLYVARRVRIKSSDGPAATHIVGRHSTNANGLGEDAVRCVTFYFGRRSLLEGFTLRDGATWNTNVNNGVTSRGGAVHCHGNQENVWIKDCVISNCIARYGAVSQHGMFVHCKIVGNNNPTGGSICRESLLYGCLLQGNTGGSCLESASAAQCTFVDDYGIVSGTSRLRNCAAVMNNASFTPGTYIDYNVQDTADGACLLKNPVFGDCRPVASGAAATAGCADGANGIAVEKEFPWFGKGTEYWTDEDCPKGHGIDGRAIEVVDGKCVAGAWAETVDFTPAAEPVVFSGKQVIEGALFNYKARVFPEAYPTSYYAKAVPASGNYVYEYVNWKDGTGYERFPEMDEGIHVTPMALGGATVTNSFVLAAKVLWLDPVSGNDSNAGTSSNAPIRTLQKIYDKRNGRTLAMCAPGTYGELGTSENGSLQYGCSNVANFVFARVRLKAYGGADKTFIRGKLDESTLDESYMPGAGYAAMRILCVQYPGQLQGFTIYNAAGGRTQTAHPDVAGLGDANSLYGGVVTCSSVVSDTGYRGVFSVADCVISNCVAVYGPAGNGVVLERGVVTNCTARYCIVRGSAARSVFVDNHFANSGDSVRSVAGEAEGHWLVDSTVIDLDGGIRPGSNGDKSVNTIYVGGDAPDGSKGLFAGCLYWNFATSRSREGLVHADPFLAPPSYRVGACSPAVGAYDTNVVNTAMCWCLLGADIDGAPPAFKTAGAFNTFVPGLGIQAEHGGIAVEGAAAVGFTPSDGFAAATITRGDGSRPCIGYTVNGVTNLFDDVETRTVSADEVTAAGGAVGIYAIYAKDWYVNADPEVGSDANSGFTPKTAKLTLKGAMEAAGLAYGDTVHAAAGDYNSLSMLQTVPRYSSCTPVVRSRVVVPSGVRLVGDEGRDATFITGEGDFTADPENGFGPNAIRCVMLKEGASIRGFTIRNGRTDVKSSADINYDDNTAGGGVLGYTVTSTTVYDCTVTNCAAYRGGAFRQLAAERCRVLGCMASSTKMAVGGDVSLYNVFCDYNKGTYLVTTYYNVVNCTFGANNTRIDDSTRQSYSLSTPGNSSARAINVLSLVPTASEGVHLRSYFTGNMSHGAMEDGSAVTNAAVLAIDGHGRPVIGSNIGIDAANPEYLTGDNAEKDADGCQRVYNGRLDIGCYDADWRATYARDISGSSRLSVDSASPEVYESDGGKVRIPAGGMIAATWNRRAGGSYLLTVTLPGDGVLTVTSNGSEIATLTGPAAGAVLALESASAVFPLELSYAGDDSYAEIAGMRPNVGFLLIVE